MPVLWCNRLRAVVLNLFCPMDHLFKENISRGPLCHADTSYTTTVVKHKGLKMVLQDLLCSKGYY